MRRAVAACLTAGLAVLSHGAAAEESSSKYARPDLLVETEWLDVNMIRPEVVVVDLRPQETYNQSHIPNSVWLEDGKLFQREGSQQHVVSADAFKSLMEAAGVDDGSHVVAVDDSGGRSASRLWWILGYYGFDHVSILNGGFSKWETEGRALTVEYPFHRQVKFTPKPRPERIATADQVKAWKSKPGGVVLDARTVFEFSGRAQRSKRAGHIPGAVNVPWDEDLHQVDGLRVFKPAPELLALYNKAGVTSESPVVAYCQDGSRASHLLFTMALIGLNPAGADYVGSWAEWGSRNDLPIEGLKPEDAATDKPAKAKAKAKSGGI
jgi:thiosulfate/3-mercaptopyruvate sulfurtransferase